MSYFLLINFLRAKKEIKQLIITYPVNTYHKNKNLSYVLILYYIYDFHSL